MSADILIDTNVLVYAQDTDEPVKRARAIETLMRVRPLSAAVTTQILGEYFVVVRRKFARAVDERTAAQQVRDFSEMFDVIETSVTVVLEAVRAVLRYRMSYSDAQVWAAARQSGISLVLSEDFDDGAEIEGVIFRNPFAAGFDPSCL